MPLLITRVCDTDDNLNPGGRGGTGEMEAVAFLFLNYGLVTSLPDKF